MVSTDFSQDQLQDRIKRMITSAGDPALILAKLTPTEAVHRPNPDDVIPIEDAIRYALENRPEMRQLDLTLEDIVTSTSHIRRISSFRNSMSVPATPKAASAETRSTARPRHPQPWWRGRRLRSDFWIQLHRVRRWIQPYGSVE